MTIASPTLASLLGLTATQVRDYRHSRTYKALSTFLFGFYFWEYVLTFSSVEWAVLSRRRPLQLNMLPYFVTRYACLGYLIPNMVIMHTPTQPNCRAVTLSLLFMAATTLIFSHVMFSLRALALWSYDRRIIAVMVLLWVPHTVLSYLTLVGVETVWVPEVIGNGGSCGVRRYSPFAVSNYALLLVVDCALGVLILLRLYLLRRTIRSPFTDLLARDLLLYLLCCIVACVAGIVIVLYDTSVATRASLYIITTQVHAVFSCRAYINTTRLAEKLPPQLQLRVHKERLDEDTLRRIAGHFGMAPYPGEGEIKSPNGSIESPPEEKAPWAGRFGGVGNLKARLSSVSLRQTSSVVEAKNNNGRRLPLPQARRNVVGGSDTVVGAYSVSSSLRKDERAPNAVKNINGLSTRTYTRSDEGHARPPGLDHGLVPKSSFPSISTSGGGEPKRQVDYSSGGQASHSMPPLSGAQADSRPVSRLSLEDLALSVEYGRSKSGSDFYVHDDSADADTEPRSSTAPFACGVTKGKAEAVPVAVPPPSSQTFPRSVEGRRAPGVEDGSGSALGQNNTPTKQAMTSPPTKPSSDALTSPTSTSNLSAGAGSSARPDPVRPLRPARFDRHRSVEASLAGSGSGSGAVGRPRAGARQAFHPPQPPFSRELPSSSSSSASPSSSPYVARRPSDGGGGGASVRQMKALPTIPSPTMDAAAAAAAARSADAQAQAQAQARAGLPTMALQRSATSTSSFTTPAATATNTNTNAHSAAAAAAADKEPLARSISAAGWTRHAES